MYKNTGLLLSLAFALFLFSCSSDRYIPSDKKEILNFAILDSLNTNLPKNIEGEIEGSTILLQVPSLTDLTALTPVFEFEGVFVTANAEPQESGKTQVDFSKPVTYTIEAEDGSQTNYKVEIERIPGIPHLYIQTENEAEINSKEDYVLADLRIDGKDIYPDFELQTKIRGRGNTTWSMPKKPYKLKLLDKMSLMGLTPAKKWILLNEYRDGSMLYNSVPFKAGKLLGIPYTHNVIPVEITLNGEYQGMYAFMEHKEVKKGRIDIGKDGWLIELDTYYNRPPMQFKSDKYELPVMVRYPKYKDLQPQEADVIAQEIQTDFEALEALIYDDSFPNNDYLKYLDDVAFVNYMIVFELTKNGEINHPKSVYLNKKKGGKYNMGILWDFDWGFGSGTAQNFYDLSKASTPLLNESNQSGTLFFKRIMKDPYMRALFKQKWQEFRSAHFEDLKEHVKVYATQVEQAHDKDHEVWGPRGSSGDLQKELKRMLAWLDARAAYMDNLY